MTSLIVILGYIAVLLGVSVFSTRLFKKTSGDYFLASRGIGPFMLLMSIFGTTMTSFALIGSSGETFKQGIGVYGMMASWSGIVHSICFFTIGARVWALGKKHGYITQLSFFYDRYRSDVLVLLLFPVLVSFVVIYILMGVVGSGRVINSLTVGAFDMQGVETRVPVDLDPGRIAIPEAWKARLSHDAAAGEIVAVGPVVPHDRAELVSMATPPDPSWEKAVNTLITCAKGAVSYDAGMVFISIVVLIYVFFGGMRATAWANTFQTIVFMAMGVVALFVITGKLGGPAEATQKLLASPAASRAHRGESIHQLQFLTYFFVPLSVAMFPHLFQHWLTAKKASNFKLTVVAFPICILITWLPCVLLGMWAAAVLPASTPQNAVLPIMVERYSGEVLSGLIGAGILAAIMSSMDSQFLCLGSLFTNDIVVRYIGKGRVTDERKIVLGRLFVVAMVIVSLIIGLFEPGTVFELGVWCFSGFASLSPIAFAALYWKRSNRQGAIATVLTVAVLWIGLLPQALGTTGEQELLFYGMMPVTILVAVSTAVLIVVTLLTPPPPRDVIEKFFPAR